MSALESGSVGETEFPRRTKNLRPSVLKATPCSGGCNAWRKAGLLEELTNCGGRRPSQKAVGHLRAISPLPGPSPVPPQQYMGAWYVQRQRDSQNDFQRARVLQGSLPLQEGKTPHSTPTEQPLPHRAPHGTSAQPGLLTFFEHSVSLLSPLAGPDLPLSAQRAMFPLSCLSLWEGR